MLTRLKKQLIFRVILPSAAILIIAGVLLSAFKDLPATGAVLVLTGLMAGISGILIVPRILKPVAEAEKAVESLENRKCLSDKAVSGQTEDPLLQSLYHISERIESQEKKIQDEKLRRLRSVIDGQDSERQRLARELHDGLGQSLIAARLQLESCEKPGISHVRSAVDASKNMIDQAIEEVRRISNALQPAALDEFGLETALRTRVMEMAAIAGIKATFECNGSIERLAKKSKIYLYRIAQEAITNIIKHARATEMTVTITREDQLVRLTVADNGKGFIIDPKSYAHRNGIQNMRERASLLSGNFTVESAPDTGTKIIVTIPYTRNDGYDKNTLG